ncbi:FMO [Mytilus coruscus]|uniref:Flavin-containing monooxygenase n=1 Tax=Mytilus coruscus TaxID=42192 RepID=A0A6J8DIR3_MYTCO|nr:FMO [Mytilus coruscus]
MKVAIIGAGASGLAAIKCCVDEGLQLTCYERTHDIVPNRLRTLQFQYLMIEFQQNISTGFIVIGGLWRYTDEVTEGQACVMKSTIINTSKEMMCYSDFPIPAEYPIFMHNSYVQKYFNLYVDKFELRKRIRFRHEIISVKPTDDFETSGQWKLKVKDLANEEEHNITYDAVMICTGHHAEKNMPHFPGLKNFQGKVLHSHDYRHTAGYEEKRVVVVGIGNSGGDVAVELSRVASQKKNRQQHDIKKNNIKTDNSPKTPNIKTDNSPKTPNIKTDNSPKTPNIKTDNSPKTPNIKTDNSPKTPNIKTDNSPKTPNIKTDNSPKTLNIKTDNSPKTPNIKTDNSPKTPNIKTDNSPKTPNIKPKI